MTDRQTRPLRESAVGAATDRYLQGQAIDMSALAEDLGVGRATLYRRVGNHEDLLGRVLELQTEATFVRTRTAPGLTGADAILDRLQKFMVAVVESRPLRALIERDPMLFVRVVMGPGRVEATATRLVAGLIDGELPGQGALDSEVLARAVVRVSDSFMYSHLLSNVEPELGAALTVIRHLLTAAEDSPARRRQPERRRLDDSVDLDAPPPLFDPSRLRAPPTTSRGMRTHAQLLAAARRVFERIGYQDARLVDITDEARCSIGTFYTYFDGKEEVFAAVLQAAQEDMLHPGAPHAPETDDPRAVIEASNRAYFESYQRNAKLMVALEQVAHVDGEFRELRRRRSANFVHRNARGIAALQESGQADPSVDPLAASRALSGMVSRLAYANFAYEDGEDGAGRLTVDELVETASRLWGNALRLTDGENLNLDSSSTTTE